MTGAKPPKPQPPQSGIALESGAELRADVIVTATGLELLQFGGADIRVDGKEYVASESMIYKGCMVTGLPNFFFCAGYTNASWTLKLDLVCEYLCRVLNAFAPGERLCRVERDPSVASLPSLDLKSGYVLRHQDRLPVQGTTSPWRMFNNWFWDSLQLSSLVSSVRDGVLRFA